MANFKQAIKWLEEGKGIKRTNWRIDGEVYLFLDIEIVMDCYRSKYRFDYDDIKAKNWKIFKEAILCEKCGKPCNLWFKNPRVCDKCKVHKPSADEVRS